MKTTTKPYHCKACQNSLTKTNEKLVIFNPKKVFFYVGKMGVFLKLKK